MKNTIVISTVAGLLSCCLISCEPAVKKDENAEQNRMETRGDASDAENQFREDFQADRAEMERRAQENNRRIADFKNQQAAPEDNTNTQGTNTTVSEDRTARVEELEERNNDLQTRLDEFSADSEESWQEFKQDFNEEMANLEEEIDKFFSDNNADNDQADNNRR